MERIDILYRNRFPEADRKAKERIWQVLCQHFFQRYVRETDTVLDLACGFGEFIRFIRARRKIAVDFNPDVAPLLPSEVEFHLGQATHLGFIPAGSVDICFTSNFFEHLPSKQVLDAVLAEVRRVLRPGGLLVALQPNIKYAANDYWDFYDHYLPLSHLSCAEAFAKAGFEVIELVGRFLPFTTRSRLPQHPLLVRCYLLVRPAWWLLGRQFLIVGRKPLGNQPREDRSEGSSFDPTSVRALSGLKGDTRHGRERCVEFLGKGSPAVSQLSKKLIVYSAPRMPWLVLAIFSHLTG